MKTCNFHDIIRLFCTAIAISMTTSAATFAQPASSPQDIANQVNLANSLLRDGKIDEAIQSYHAVTPREQDKNQLNYNLAVAEYRKGNIDTAQQLFSEVAGTSNTTLAADSRYNLGNCLYTKGMASAKTDRTAAIEFLKLAIADYRGSLRINPNNSDARANIELAGELIRKLQNEQKKEDEQQQQEPQDENQNQSQDDPHQNKNKQADKQGSEQNKSQSPDEKKEKEQDKSSSAQDESDDQSGKQSNKGDTATNEQKSEGQEDNQPEDSDQPGQKPGAEPRDHTSQSKANQSGTDSSQTTGNPDQSATPQEPDTSNPSDNQESENQAVPSGELKSANEENADKKPAATIGNQDPENREGMMTREEALKMLQAVRDRDMLRRMQQQRQERSRRVTVERDW